MVLKSGCALYQRTKVFRTFELQSRHAHYTPGRIIHEILRYTNSYIVTDHQNVVTAKFRFKIKPSFGKIYCSLDIFIRCLMEVESFQTDQEWGMKALLFTQIMLPPQFTSPPLFGDAPENVQMANSLELIFLIDKNHLLTSKYFLSKSI